MSTPSMLISGWYGNGNLGDEAILDGILKAVRAAEPTVGVSVLSDSPGETEERLGVPAVPRGGRRLLHEGRAIRRSDLFVLGGGGLIKDYGTAPGAADVWLKPLVVARLLGKQTMTYAIGVDDVRFRASCLRVRRALRFAQTITVRDVGSAERLRTTEVSGRCLATADPAILLAAPGGNRCPGPRPRIGVNIRHWFTFGRYVDNPAGVQRLEAELAHGLDALIEQSGAQVLFVPFRRVPIDDDLAAWSRVRAQMAHQEAVVEADLPSTPTDASELLAGCDFVIGTRLHSLVLAAANGVPVYGLSYMPKVTHFLRELGLDTAYANAGVRSTTGWLAHELTGWFGRRHETRPHLAERVGRLRELALVNGELAVALLTRDRGRAAAAEDRIVDLRATTGRAFDA